MGVDKEPHFFFTISMFLKKIDDLFSFGDFTGSTREEGYQAA